MTLSLIFSTASLILCGFTFIYLLGYLRRRTGERILDEEEVDKLIAGIDAAADRDITLLEDRSKAIKSLLETLDRRIAAYARELGRRDAEETALKALSPDAPGPATDPQSKSARSAEGAYAALGKGLRATLRVNPPEPAAQPEASADPAASHAEPPDDAAQPGQPRFVRSANPVQAKAPLSERALELSRNGFSPETIAARLGVTQAEVNLALAMSERKRPE
jgi:hypothetical protein